MKQVRLLNANEIECRVATVSEKGASLLLYKDARVDFRILDESFSPMGWKRTHQSIDGNLYCTVEIYDPDKQEWVAKQDVGVASYSEKEKGQASDSFKRACFNWGIGRELYTAPFIWIPRNKVNIQEKGGKYVTYDRFQVQYISYNDQREITALVIVNGEGKMVFEMKTGLSMPQTGTEPGALSELQQKQLRDELERTGVEVTDVLQRYQLANINEMSPEIYKKAMNSLKRTKTKAAA